LHTNSFLLLLKIPVSDQLPKPLVYYRQCHMRSPLACNRLKNLLQTHMQPEISGISLQKQEDGT